MKNIIFAAIVVFCSTCIVSAIGPLPTDLNQRQIQGHAPNKLKLRNDSKTGTKVFQNISVAGYQTIKIVCTDGTGNLKPCRAKPDSQSAYIAIPTGERTIILSDSTIQAIRFENVSGVSSTTMFNSER